MNLSAKITGIDKATNKIRAMETIPVTGKRVHDARLIAESGVIETPNPNSRTNHNIQISKGERARPRVLVIASSRSRTFPQMGIRKKCFGEGAKTSTRGGCAPRSKPRCALSFARSRKTAIRIKSRRCDETSAENPEESFVSFVIFCSRPNRSQPHNAALSTPKAFASHYRLNAINFRSLRRCVKASPAIASAPPIHVLGSGTAAAITVSTMSLPSPPV